MGEREETGGDREKEEREGTESEVGRETKNGEGRQVDGSGRGRVGGERGGVIRLELDNRLIEMPDSFSVQS